MNKYFTTFQDIDAYNSFVASQELPNINVSYIIDSDDVKYYKEHVSLQPFTMEIVSLPEGIDSISLSFVNYNYTTDGFASHGKYKFSYDEGETWTNWYEVNGTNQTFNDEIVLHEGDKISIIGGYGNIVNIFHFFQDRNIPEGGVKINVSGNVSSLLLGEDFYLKTLDEIDYEYGTNPWGDPFGPFYQLFDATDFPVYVLDASDLWLPGSGLVPSCYAKMFKSQIYLTTDIPNIYADWLPVRACESMFEGCTSLTTMPDIYTTILEKGDSLDYMFKGCTSLVTTKPFKIKHMNFNADEYGHLFLNTFEGCTSLTTAPQFSFTQLEDINMITLVIGDTFNGCTSLTSCDWNFNFESIGSVTYLDLHHMFDGCTSLTTSPVITGSSKQISPNNMFNNCTSLSTIIWTNTALGPEYLGSFTEDISTLPAVGTLVLADSMTQEGWLGVIVPSTWTIMTWTQYQSQNNS